jgi:calcineurin-like phosphoesterase family protein/2'-5' RNA ligase
MAHFLVEFRLHGYAREYAIWARARTLREARRLGVRRLQEPRFVPHITLFGAAETRNIRSVVREVERVGRRYDLVPFKLGIRRGDFQKGHANWLYLNVEPSAELEQFRYELAQSLLNLEGTISDTCRSHDRDRRYTFHCSIGEYDPRDSAKFQKLAEYAETKCGLETFRQRRTSLLGRLVNTIEKSIFKTGAEAPGISQHVLRVTVLGRGSRIQCEYDLILKRLLSRKEGLSVRWWRRTIGALNVELGPLREEHVPTSNACHYHFIGDTHFDHRATITRFIHRPFSDIDRMNEAIRYNWNRRVGENDKVYFLGDYTGPPPKDWEEYYKELRRVTGRLRGIKVSILGNHDRIGGCMEFEKARILRVGQYRFLLIHNPSDRRVKTIKAKYDWVIHGHVHNNEMDRYPFINGEQKTINVGVELLDYEPVSLEHLLSLDLGSIKRMRTIDSRPERW